MTEEEKETEIQEEENSVSISEKELEELTQYKHKYLQMLADSDNARKRIQKEKGDVIQYAIQNVILEFLNPIDHMENALGFTDQASDDVKHWAVGFEMILTQMKDVLASHGVRAMETVGKAFDPHLHEAVEMVETEDENPGTVVEESLRGYHLGERVLRPARVKVAKAPETEKLENNE